jgi:hypothetical protein
MARYAAIYFRGLKCDILYSKRSADGTCASTIMTHPKLAVILAAVLFAGSASVAIAQGTGEEKPKSAAPARTTADIKEETEAGIPYQPCPANVRFPSGQQMCLGLPAGPGRPYHTPRER